MINLGEKLQHLPPGKVRRIESAVELILQNQVVEMIILFGSYARGDYKQTRIEEVGGYKVRFRSDYDLLLVTERECGEGELIRSPVHSASRYISTAPHELRQLMSDHDDAVQMITIDIETLNHEISEWHYFYSDIYREGIVLYDSGNYELVAPPEHLSPTLRRQYAEEDFAGWFKRGNNFLRLAQLGMMDEIYTETAFVLEQTCEALYRAVIMVYTHYNPNEHNLYDLRRDAEQYAPSLKDIFPLYDQEISCSFKRLHLAYIEARFFYGYEIDIKELKFWYDELKKLSLVVNVVGEEKIKALRLLEE